MPRFNISHIKVLQHIDANHHQKSSPAHWLATLITTQIPIFIVQWYLFSQRGSWICEISWSHKYIFTDFSQCAWGRTHSCATNQLPMRNYWQLRVRFTCEDQRERWPNGNDNGGSSRGLRSCSQSISSVRIGECFPLKGYQVTAFNLPAVFSINIIYQLAPLVVACV